ncbi:hypothetical protein JTB14_004120 [Gonioctena quinquepunctata]|nr:hypothetical protein JTB14_004120 [Gonioctena quinquepunctata]
MNILILSISVLFNIKSSAAHNLGIVEGRTAAPGEFPYQVYLRQTNVSDEIFLYNGAIISPSWVLSAGRCINETVPLEILVGTSNLTEDTCDQQRVEVDKVIVHPDFDLSKSLNDIALLKLKTPLEFNDCVQPATLPEKYVLTGEKAVTSGWGIKGGFNPYPIALQAMDVETISFEECVETLAPIKNETSDYWKNDIASMDALDNKTKICTGPLDKGIATCMKDEGSPLAQNRTVIGIASFIIQPCGREGSPSVFSRVSEYVSWIKENVDENLNIL